MMAKLALAAAIAMLGAGLVGAALAFGPDAEPASPGRGAAVYATACAACHGASLEGAAAPPLGVDGHAWRHDDAALAAIIARGSAAGMPGFGGRLRREEIASVLLFVKRDWSAEMRAWQAALAAGGGEALAALLRDPEARLPPDCAAPRTYSGLRAKLNAAPL